LWLQRQTTSFRFHHPVSGPLVIPLEVGRNSAGKWGRIPGHVGHDSAEVGQPGRLPLWYLSDHFV
jgi:hypothetical protein